MDPQPLTNQSQMLGWEYDVPIFPLVHVTIFRFQCMETARTWSIWDMNPNNPQMTQGNNSITYRCSKFPTHL